MKNPLASLLAVLSLALAPATLAQEDPGRAAIGKIEVNVIFATNGDASVAGESAAAIEENVSKRLHREERLRFAEYRLLGSDAQPILRSYENWAQPLKPSDEILVRFETRSLAPDNSIRLDLEVWLSRKKTLKTDAHLQLGRPLFILGPEWRGGRLIIAVSLLQS